MRTFWIFLSLIILFPLSDVSHNNITALPGENVSLPCQVSNMNFTVLNWSRSDLLPQYVFMYKDKKPSSENQHPSFKGRVELAAKHMKDGNISVILKNVTTNDSGTYTCEIIWNRTKLREIISRVNLQVQPGPKAGHKRDGVRILILSALVVLLGLVIVILALRNRKINAEEEPC
ncbi:myelin-oligodendrocyte glycoprotein-like [Echeneis naucrates]|uniref:myelin-oligodendrocyte glycoprotein-like n=1 Tax=Echeneis naucrates TaxID=173247 RepID=UPI00111354B7|nr:myelin-oligodendrocyte glycoprotein-like [Echeneis naucrates]